MKTFFFSFCFFLNLIHILAQCPILPHPVYYDEKKDYYEITDWNVDLKSLPENLKIFFDFEVKNRFSQNLIESKKTNFVFEYLHSDNPDLYKIIVDDKIRIQFSSDKSCFYALNTFLQLIEKNESNQLIIKKCEIEDYPKFQWRGLHLDVSRHFFTVDEIKRYIDLMAYYKFNVFHWHLTDDQGWRIEIKKYPKLTEIGAWRDSTVNNHYSTKPRTYTKEKYGGFYTQEQIKELVQYAQNKFITIIPEIEMPGHSRAVLAAYPELSCTGKQQSVPGLWGIFDDVFCSKPESIKFIKDILDEVCELFPSEYIHIGGDEAPKTRWKSCSNCQKIIRDNKLKDVHELQSYFIKQIDAYLSKKGKIIIGWDEILEGGLSPNAIVMSWRGFDGGIEALKQSHKVIMTPGSHCYFDHYQSENPNEPLAIGGYTPLEKVYDFNPIPSGLTKEQEKLILGAQANLWTEYIPNMKQLEYMTYPRAIALSQVLWCEKKPDYNQFEKTLTKHHFPFLDYKKVNYSKAIYYPFSKIKKTNTGLNVKILMKADSLEELAQYNFHRSNYPKQKKFNIDVEGTKLNFLLHAGIGANIHFQTLPNEKYRNNYELNLVDGILGKKPWNGKEWLGFDTSQIIFKLDLLEITNISKITLSLLDDNGSWIYLPEKITCSVSSNNLNWEKIELKNINEKNLFEYNKMVQYIQFEIQSIKIIPEGKDGAGFKPWTFIDEVIVETE
jgi:hexosaminidase